MKRLIDMSHDLGSWRALLVLRNTIWYFPPPADHNTF